MRVLEFRKSLLDEGYRNPEFANGVWLMCSQDLLFFCDAFGWMYDPRREDLPDSPYPFVTWPFQAPTLLGISAAIEGKHDLLIQKSRDMGASWMILYVLTWRFIFRKHQSFLIASRKEDLVDDRGNPDSLFWKIDCILEHLPEWIRPNVDRTNMHMENMDGRSVIDGESTNKAIGVGGRRTALMLDEVAQMSDGMAIIEATADVSKCRLFNSSFYGTGDAFYLHSRKCQVQIKLPWWLHPEKAEGLYYGPHGKRRSPWYDAEDARRHPWEMANQVDMNPEGGNFGFFEEPLVNRLLAMCAPPIRMGVLEFDKSDIVNARFVGGRAGPLRVWAVLDGQDRLPGRKQYVIGADVATGNQPLGGIGASNSVLSVLDAETGEFVAEYASASVDPYEFGMVAVAVGNWLAAGRFDGAEWPLIIWEHHGPGTLFAKALVEAGYPRIYFRDDHESKLAPLATDKIGFAQGRESKVTLLGEYRQALKAGSVLNRSVEAILELRGYVYDKSGNVDYVGNLNFVDPTQAKANHGDRVIANALAWRAGKPLQRQKKQDDERVIPMQCFYRRQQAARKERAAGSLY